MQRLGLFLILVLTFSAFSAPAFAVPFSFEYNDTISSTNIAGLSVGQAAKITVTLDNGNSTNLGQTWTATDLQSVTYDFNNGGLVTTFNAPFDGGLFATFGDFTSDGAGTLMTVMSGWRDQQATTDFSTTGTAAEFTWYLNGGNPVYFQRPVVGSGTFSRVYLTNVNDMLSADNWSPVPEPSTMLLFGTGLLGLMGYSWRRKRQEAKT